MKRTSWHGRLRGQRGAAILEWVIVIVLVAVIAIVAVKTFGREANLANCKVGLGLERRDPSNVYNGNHYFYDEETGESHCSRTPDGNGPGALLW